MQWEAKTAVRCQKHERLNAMTHQLKSNSLQQAVKFTQEQGAFTWLTTLPIAKYGFHLNKKAFHDALVLRYGWLLLRTPTH